MKKILTLVVIATALASSSAAYADWENTHWGDSVEQVIAAVGNGAKIDQGDDDDRVLDQDQRATRTGDFHGVAAKWTFFFGRTGGLSLVKIEPKRRGDCDAFLAAATAPLGKPKKSERKLIANTPFITHEWADRKANLAILAFELGRSMFVEQDCHVTYRPYGNGKPGKRN